MGRHLIAAALLAASCCAAQTVVNYPNNNCPGGHLPSRPTLSATTVGPFTSTTTFTVTNNAPGGLVFLAFGLPGSPWVDIGGGCYLMIDPIGSVFGWSTTTTVNIPLTIQTPSAWQAMVLSPYAAGYTLTNMVEVL